MSEKKSESTYFPLPTLLNRYSSAQGHLVEQVSEALKVVSQVVSPVAPPEDLVAVNPYHGISERSFLNARKYLRIFSDCETLMSLEFYAEEFHSGQFGIKQIQSAIEELDITTLSAHQIPSVKKIVELLQSLAENVDNQHRSPEQLIQRRNRPVRTLSEMLDDNTQCNWSELICDEISKYCAMHYDQGEAFWPSPWKEMTLYQSWRSAAVYDRNLEFHGLSGTRRYISQLPHTPEISIISSLKNLKVPQVLWETYLLCQAFSIRGWSGWIKHQSLESGIDDLPGLLAMRLAYDAALSRAKEFEIDWSVYPSTKPISFKLSTDSQDDDILRYTLLRAAEIAFRDRLLRGLSVQTDASQVDSEPTGQSSAMESGRKFAQIVFCSDTRLERIRRHLESLSCKIETFESAGLIGKLREFEWLRNTPKNNQASLLQKPEKQICEDLKSDLLEKHGLSSVFQQLGKYLRTTAVNCFPFFEKTVRPLGFKLWQLPKKLLAEHSKTTWEGWDSKTFETNESGLNHPEKQGVTSDDIADLAESMFKHLDLTENFSRIVILCGHCNQTDNNPLKAGLDYGELSGEPDVRIIAQFLNQDTVRHSLKDRGITIPSDTWFIAGSYNTTTDGIDFTAPDRVPETHHEELKALIKLSQIASEKSRVELMPLLNAPAPTDLLQRAGDWPETGPEWKLSGKTAFVIASREYTWESDLDARIFLHDYDHKHDPEGVVLEKIMTDSMLTAHWNNMQNYASTVDKHYLGSDNNSLHHAVGGFGVLSGNSGDLVTGLPWQSPRTGSCFQHKPIRLQVVIAAPGCLIEKIISKHQNILNLLTGDWMHLVSLDEGQAYQYSTDGIWKKIALSQT